MFRNGKSTTFFLIGSLCVICVISYNYWQLSQKNFHLRDVLFTDKEKINDLEEEKAQVEKQNGINLDRIKFFEDRMNANSAAIKQKDREIDELNTKLKLKEQDFNKILLELNETKEKLVNVYLTI
jgi:hypothetical protein